MSSAVFMEGRCPNSRAVLRRSETTAFSHSIDEILGRKATPASSTMSAASSTDQYRVLPQTTTLRIPPVAGSSTRGPGSSRRRARTNYSPEQLTGLETLFADNQYPGIDEREALAGAVDLSEARIQVWFQNRRARLHRKQRGSLGGASSPDTTSPKAIDESSLRPTKRSRLSTSSNPVSSLKSLSPPLAPPASHVSLIPASPSPPQYLQVCTQACCTPSVPRTHLMQSGPQYLTGASSSYYPWATLGAFQSAGYPYSYIYPGTGPLFYDYTLPLSASVPVTSVHEVSGGLDSSSPDAPSSVPV